MPGNTTYMRLLIGTEPDGTYQVPDDATVIGMNYLSYPPALEVLRPISEVDYGKGTVSDTENTEGA